jgi:hypothetical protein
MFTDFGAWSILTDDIVWLEDHDPMRAMIKVYYDTTFEQDFIDAVECVFPETAIACS